MLRYFVLVIFLSFTTSSVAKTEANSNSNSSASANTKEKSKAAANSNPQKSTTKSTSAKSTSENMPASTENAKTDKKNLATKNLTESNVFFESNKKKPGVVTLPSGLQYKIVKEGTGKKPSPTGFVTVNYQGTLLDGTVFDSSYKLQEPVTFAVNAVIPGWTEALQLMSEGSKWTVYVPPQLAYGEKGVGRLIGPNQALIFDIELVDTDDNLSEEFKEKKSEEWEDPSPVASP